MTRHFTIGIALMYGQKVTEELNFPVGALLAAPLPIVTSLGGASPTPTKILNRRYAAH